MKRSQARENAFILVFEKSINNASMSEIIDSAVEVRELEDNQFTRCEAIGVFEHIDEIDALIEKHCVGWKLNRVSRVALSAMRICCYELLYENDIPESVSINEAVELTKKYAGDEDSSYVNGVLGSIAKGIS